MDQNIFIYLDIKLITNLFFLIAINDVLLFQKTPKVDFVSINPLADPNFDFYDQRLLDIVSHGDPTACEFFRLLALCHTVMAEEKGQFYQVENNILF